MDNRTQPILCCVGAEVAGEPTQFLMERAASASHWDWHVITVEVAPDMLPKAWEGMVVMRFSAVRFFQPHQSSAMHLVTTPVPMTCLSAASLLRCAPVRVGRCGTIAAQLCRSCCGLACPGKKTICWLHGNTSRTRSFLVACANDPPRHILWTGSQAAAHTAAGTSLPEALAAKLPLKIIPSEGEAEIGAWLAAQFAEDSQPQAVVHAGEVESRHFDTLASCQPETGCMLLVVAGTPGTRRKLSDLWRAGEVTILAPADVVVAEEAYDQVRWTGQSTNIEVLKEAYDEYADF